MIVFTITNNNYNCELCDKVFSFGTYKQPKRLLSYISKGEFKMCPYINEGMNVNGSYYYCDAAALGIKLSAKELADIGCTGTQRKTCKSLMEMTLGYALLPDPVEKNTNVIIDFNRDSKKLCAK